MIDSPSIIQCAVMHITKFVVISFTFIKQCCAVSYFLVWFLLLSVAMSDSDEELSFESVEDDKKSSGNFIYLLSRGAWQFM